MKKDIMENYINTIYLDIIFDKTGSIDFASILILDSATMHLIADDFNPYTKNNIYEVFIPKGLTHVCQPLDIFINKIFKDKMKKLYLSWRANLIESQTRVKRKNVVGIVLQL